MRGYFQRPINITSGARCKDYNEKVGGVTNSMHIQGKATDLSTNDLTNKEQDYLVLCAGRAGFTAISKYENFIHVDTGKPRFW
jgi:uncharacterized protein YcbK (DUF882 family)